MTALTPPHVDNSSSIRKKKVRKYKEPQLSRDDFDLSTLQLYGQLETINSPRRSVPLFNEKKSPLERVLKRFRSSSESPIQTRTHCGRAVSHEKQTISKTSIKKVSSKSSTTKKRFSLNRNHFGDDQVPSKKDSSTKHSKQEIKVLRHQLTDLERQIRSLTVSKELILSAKKLDQKKYLKERKQHKRRLSQAQKEHNSAITLMTMKYEERIKSLESRIDAHDGIDRLQRTLDAAELKRESGTSLKPPISRQLSRIHCPSSVDSEDLIDSDINDITPPPPRESRRSSSRIPRRNDDISRRLANSSQGACCSSWWGGHRKYIKIDTDPPP